VEHTSIILITMFSSFAISLISCQIHRYLCSYLYNHSQVAEQGIGKENYFILKLIYLYFTLLLIVLTLLIM